MRRLVRWLFRLVILAIVLAVALVLMKDILIKALAERRIRERTGLGVAIRRLELGLLAPTCTIEGLRLFNTPEFGGSVLMDISEIHLEYDTWKAAAGKLHLRLLRVHLDEVNLVRDRFGQTNLFRLLARTNAPATEPASLRPRQRWMHFDGIDRAYLSLGTVKFTDLGGPGNNWVRAIGWKDYEIQNVRTAEEARDWANRLLLRAAAAPSQPATGAAQTHKSPAEKP